MQSCPLPKDEKTICYGKSPSVQRALTRTTAEIWPVSFTMREQPLTLRWTTLVSLVAKKGHVFTMSRFTGLCWVCIHGASTFSPIILVSSLVGTVALTKLGGRWCYKHLEPLPGHQTRPLRVFVVKTIGTMHSFYDPRGWRCHTPSGAIYGTKLAASYFVSRTRPHGNFREPRFQHQ